MLVSLRETVTRVLAHVELRVPRGEDEPPPAPVPPPRRPVMVERHDDPNFRGFGGGAAAAVVTAPAAGAPWAKTPRNAPCPCGSGKKYKHCHGRI
jgi:preprotein translocase subunit SecA